MVCIIDDREDIWNYAPHLVHVKPYRFFQGTADINAPPGLDKTDDVSEEIHADDALHKPEPDGATPDNNTTPSTTLFPGAPSTTMSSYTPSSTIPSSAPSTTPPASSSSTSTEEGSATNEGRIAEAAKSLDGKTSEGYSSDRGSGDSDEIHRQMSAVGSSGIGNQSAVEREAQRESGRRTQTDRSDAIAAMGADNQADSTDMDTSDNSGAMAESQIEASSTQTDANSSQTEASSTQTEATSSQTEASSMSTEEENAAPDSSTDIPAKKEDSSDEVSSSTEKDPGSSENLIEWADPDDYLLYLEEILTRIHRAYYDFYSEYVVKKTSSIPDLKNIIPYVKRKVLKGVNLVFSGVEPRRTPPEKSKAYQIAKSLGANVQEDLVRNADGTEATTHLVAAKLGTSKVNHALRDKAIKVVTPDWLWCCAHRWEKVDERLFLLKSNGQARSYACDSPVARPRDKRKHSDVDAELSTSSEKRLKLNSDPVPSTSSAGAAADVSDDGQEFRNEISPMLKFSKEDLDSMDQEVHDLMGSDDDDSDDENDDRSSKGNSNKDDGDDDARFLEDELRKKVLSGEESDSSSADSLSAEFPKGWKHQYKRRHSWPAPDEPDGDSASSDDERQVAAPRTADNRRRRGLKMAPDTDSSNHSADSMDSIGSVDEEMAEAVEREFLNI